MGKGYITRRGGAGSAPAPAEDWVRPADWLPMPSVTDTEQKFVGLHAVWPGADVLNVCALLFRGAYTVDWGDGTVEDFADNVKAEHLYDYSTISSSTDSVRGYRQVLVTVTPQAGQNLTTINFQQRYTGENTAYSTGWLDVVASFPNAASGTSVVFGGTVVGHRLVERANVLTIGGCTSCANLFQNCLVLQSVPLFNTSSVTNMSSMFNGCAAIRSVSLFNTSLVTNMSSMFNFCIALQEVPLFNTSLVTTMATMFASCHTLQSVPLFNTSAVTTMASMFSNCYTIKSVPLFNTGAVTTMSSMFSSCNSFESIPLLNTSAVTTMASMFINCGRLFLLPALSTAAITTSAGTDYGVNFALSNSSLRRCEMVFARTVGFANSALDVTALVEIFTNLVDRSATTSATITITNSKGAAALTAGDRLIATSKNWTITG